MPSSSLCVCAYSLLIHPRPPKYQTSPTRGPLPPPNKIKETIVNQEKQAKLQAQVRISGKELLIERRR